MNLIHSKKKMNKLYVIKINIFLKPCAQNPVTQGRRREEKLITNQYARSTTLYFILGKMDLACLQEKCGANNALYQHDHRCLMQIPFNTMDYAR